MKKSHKKIFYNCKTFTIKYLRTTPESHLFYSFIQEYRDNLFSEQVENSLSLNVLYGMYTQTFKRE